MVNYSTVAGLAFAVGVVFWLCFYKLDRKEEEMNSLGDGTEALSAKEVLTQHIQPSAHITDSEKQ